MTAASRQLLKAHSEAVVKRLRIKQTQSAANRPNMHIKNGKLVLSNLKS
jgi:hypothetical protein